MKSRTLIPTLGLALLLAACGGAARNQASVSESAPQVAAGMPAQATGGGAAAEAPAAIEEGSTGNTQSQLPDQQQQTIDRLIIKNADISVQVESVRDAETAIRANVAALGGYIVKSENSGTDADMTTRLTFRVPAARFDDSLAGVQSIAKKVIARSISGDDVTQEFIDLESRMRNLEATRDRLLTLLNKADKVEDAISVNNALTDVQGQIEQIKGRMQYLRQNAAMSTVVVFLAPVPTTPPIIEEDSWQPVRVARNALRAMVEIGQGLVNVVIVLLVWTPLWLPFVVLAIWLRRRWRRSRVTPPVAPTPDVPSQTA